MSYYNGKPSRQSKHNTFVYYKYNAIRFLASLAIQIFLTSGFWPRVRARALRAPVFFGSFNMPNGALRAPPPMAASLLLINPTKRSLRPELAPRGAYIFHWAKLHCTLLSYIASYGATLHHTELRCTLMSYTAPY